MTGQVPRQLIMDLGDLNVLLFDLWYNLNHSLPLISGLDFPLFRFAAYLRLLYQDIVLWFFILQRCCMLWVDLMGRVSQNFPALMILKPQLSNSTSYLGEPRFATSIWLLSSIKLRRVSVVPSGPSLVNYDCTDERCQIINHPHRPPHRFELTSWVHAHQYLPTQGSRGEEEEKGKHRQRCHCQSQYHFGEVWTQGWGMATCVLVYSYFLSLIDKK